MTIGAALEALFLLAPLELILIKRGSEKDFIKEDQARVDIFALKQKQISLL